VQQDSLAGTRGSGHSKIPGSAEQRRLDGPAEPDRPVGSRDRHGLSEQRDVRSAQRTQAIDVIAQARERPEDDALRVQDLDQAVAFEVRAFFSQSLPLGYRRLPQGLSSGNVPREIAQHDPHGGVVLAVLSDTKGTDRQHAGQAPEFGLP